MTIFRQNFLWGAVALMFLAVVSPGARADVPIAIAVSDVWARPTMAGRDVAAIYLVLTNSGDEADRLLEVETPAAEMAMIHESVTENGVTAMHHRDSLDIPPHQTVTLAPGGLHVMLMGLAKPLVAGETLPLTLHFERAGRMAVKIAVQPAALGPH